MSDLDSLCKYMYTEFNQSILGNKNVFFRALPESPNPPPHPQLGPLFFYAKNDVLCVWQEKKIDADNEGCNDNYDDIYDKND